LLASSSTKRLLGASGLRDALDLRLVPQSCARSRIHLALRCLRAYGPSFNAAWQRNPSSVTNARAKSRQLWKLFNLPQSCPRIPPPSLPSPERRFCTACATRMCAKGTFFCWWEPRRERSSFAPTRSEPGGMWVAPIFTVTMFTLWPLIPEAADIAYGRRRKAIGALSCDPVTTSERVGRPRSRPRFDSLLIPVFP